MHSLFTLINILFTLFFAIPFDGSKETDVCLSQNEMALFNAINDYRKQKNLPAVPLSAAMTQVAQVHARDLMENYELNQQCNPHSWSDEGDWTGCCYSNDHKNPKCMWDKPKEIAGYPAAGYEIVFWNSLEAKPAAALEGWKKSPGHNQVIVNSDIWKKVTWKAMGVAIYKNYAIAWFGDTLDEKGKPQICKKGQNNP